MAENPTLWRRTQIQRWEHLRQAEERLVRGVPHRVIVRELGQKYQLTPRQVRHDLKQVFERWQRNDDRLLSQRAARRDLALAADRRERDWRQALADDDPKRSADVEKDRSKLLGVYADERKRRPHVPQKERRQTVDALYKGVETMYAAAPRNADGSVVLTAFSQTRPPVDDAEYRQAIENPLGTGETGGQGGGETNGEVSPERQARIDELRDALAEGTDWGAIEQLACQRFGLSKRVAREDVLLLVKQLEEDGERIRQGTHELQTLTLAMRRRELIAEMAARQNDERLLRDLELDRCKLLGLYAKDRREKPSASDEKAVETEAERMIEVEFARLDRQHGHRHTVAELTADQKGLPSVPGRQPFKPPLPEDWDPAVPYPSVENDDWLTEDLGPDWDDTRREDDYEDLPRPAATGEPADAGDQSAEPGERPADFGERTA